MKVLEFAFDPSEEGAYLPHRQVENCICYASSHDTAPLMLWKEEADPKVIEFATEYLGINDKEGFNPGIIRGGMSSVAKLFITQMQDWLELGEGCRMNSPGKPDGNWQWRMLPDEAGDELAEKIYKITKRYGRASL